MNLCRLLPNRLLAAVSITTLFFCAGTSFAVTVSMPTPSGDHDFDSQAFAFATLAGPSGPFACFTAGALSACSPAAMQIAALGADLTTGLTLGASGAVTLAVPMIGSSLAIWEAGDSAVASDVSGLLMSVHTSTGWTALQSFATGQIEPVLGDTQPSGYSTNFGMFSAADFGLAQGNTFDAVRIDACCGADSHFDILAVAVDVGSPGVAAVPEPSTYALLLPGLWAMALVARRRHLQARSRSICSSAVLRCVPPA
jgi:hypothetical protein